MISISWYLLNFKTLFFYFSGEFINLFIFKPIKLEKHDEYAYIFFFNFHTIVYTLKSLVLSLNELSLFGVRINTNENFCLFDVCL